MLNSLLKDVTLSTARPRSYTVDLTITQLIPQVLNSFTGEFMP